MNKYRIQITQLFEYLGEIQEKKVYYKDVFEKSAEFAIWKIASMYQKEEIYLLRVFGGRFINSKRDTFTSNIQRELDEDLLKSENYAIVHNIKLVPYFYNWFNMQKYTPKQLKRKFRIEAHSLYTIKYFYYENKV